MDVPAELKAVLAENRAVRFVEDDIYSVLPDVPHEHHYDSRATVYDLIVGTRLYNRVMWGNSPLDYVAFARQAVASHADGRLLDAGSGSLLFTASVYLARKQPIVAFDQSLAMLRRAQKRLQDLFGAVPEHVTLLQADLNDLPFRAESFQTILCLNVLHLFEPAEKLFPALKKLLADQGDLFLTSLVLNNRFIGDRYLDALYVTGEFVRPRTMLELKEILVKSFGQGVNGKTIGNMAYIAARLSTARSADCQARAQ